MSTLSSRFLLSRYLWFFMTCISGGSLETGRHGDGGLSIYPGGSPAPFRNQPTNYGSEYARCSRNFLTDYCKRAGFGNSFELGDTEHAVLMSFPLSEGW